MPAERLLATGDVGLMPWLPLTDFSQPPEEIIEHCRNAIEAQAPPGEKANLLAVTQVLASLRYNDGGLATLLGGPRKMIESPLIQELVSAGRHRDILAVLESRFDEVPFDLATRVKEILDEDQLDVLVRKAASCDSLDEFWAEVPAGS